MSPGLGTSGWGRGQHEEQVGGQEEGSAPEPGSLGLSVHSRGRRGGLWGEAPAAASDLAQAALRKDAARRREEQEASRGPEATPPPQCLAATGPTVPLAGPQAASPAWEGPDGSHCAAVGRFCPLRASRSSAGRVQRG